MQSCTRRLLCACMCVNVNSSQQALKCELAIAIAQTPCSITQTNTHTNTHTHTQTHAHTHTNTRGPTWSPYSRQIEACRNALAEAAKLEDRAHRPADFLSSWLEPMFGLHFTLAQVCMSLLLGHRSLLLGYGSLFRGLNPCLGCTSFWHRYACLFY